ncbi:MAG TPA: ATP-dependent 6-phosphofructokinase [Burkholderiales bacterium]|nr:ATP-dependent 6-phosphofructokinase [Burkholderiales bacterium]
MSALAKHNAVNAPSAVTLSGSTALAGPITAADVRIKDLGKCLLPSPVVAHLGESAVMFAGAAEKVLVDDRMSVFGDNVARAGNVPAFELAGPRDKVFFDPRTVGCGIVTCGGLCPGINNVVRGLVLELARGYGVKRILGFRFGYEGLISRFGHDPVTLTAESVAHIHHQGGTILGSSRGSQDPGEVIDNLEANGINILFVIGGDGTIRGAMHFTEEIERRGLKIAVVGVPKTIDNDIHFIDRSFGFESAYSAAVDVVRSARVEAMGARNGIGLVKLMGRHSGFVACQAALASADVDLVLIPEVNAMLEGERGVFANLDRVLARKGHAVVVVAEGAAQELMTDDAADGATDKSGNAKLKDIGVYLRERITEHYRQAKREITLKYIDPSYTIRSVPATPSDSVYCWNMARNAVHAAMAGNTEMLIGRWHGRFVHVPMPLATRSRKQVDVTADLWMSVIEATGQPRSFA